MVAVYYLILLLPAILSSLLGPTSHDQQNNHHHRHQHVITQLREAELKVAQLELALEEIIENVNGRDRYLKEHEKQIEEMEKEIKELQSTLSNLKGDSSPANEKIKALEEEEAEERLEIVTSQVEKMADIVSEQWIQIQQFEQALQLREMRLLKAQKKARSPRCAFLKFMNELSGEYLPKTLGLLDSQLLGKGPALRSYMSQTLHQLKRCYSTVKQFHQELQGFIKQEMKRHKFTACLAHEEVVFFAASALIIFPVLSALALLSSQLC